MSRLGFLLMLGALLILIGQAQATTINGEVVEISGLNDLSATADSQARTGFGKIFAYGLMGAGVATAAAGYPMAGSMAGGAGLVWAFVPRIVNTAMDAASSATPTDVVTHASSTIQVLQGVLGLRNLQDPVFLLTLMLVVLLGLRTRRTVGA